MATNGPRTRRAAAAAAAAPESRSLMETATTLVNEFLAMASPKPKPQPAAPAQPHPNQKPEPTTQPAEDPMEVCSTPPRVSTADRHNDLPDWARDALQQLNHLREQVLAAVAMAGAMATPPGAALRSASTSGVQVGTQAQVSSLEKEVSCLKASLEQMQAQLKERSASGHTATSSEESSAAMQTLHSCVKQLQDTQPRLVTSQLVLHNVPKAWMRTEDAVKTYVLQVAGVRVARAWLLNGGSSKSTGVSSWAIEFNLVDRSTIVGRASEMKSGKGIVVVPFLTAFGMALRRQRQAVFAQLWKDGASPSWRRGAEIRYKDKNGKWVLWSF